MNKPVRIILILILLLGLLWSCSTAGPTGTAKSPVAASDAAPLQLTLLHLNDTHSKLEPTQVKLIVDIDESLKGKAVYLELGGFPRLWAALEQLRKERPNPLFLDAGDIFQGTLYFTQFEGKADVDFLNAMGLEAMVLGNHEFDKGPPLVKKLTEMARFPILASNVDFSAEPTLAAGGIKPYVLKDIGGSRVAIVGLTTPESPYISSPGPKISFSDPVAGARKTVQELESQGVNKIILLCHLGYPEELALAKAVKGVDVILGGHSHTLLGSLSDLGLASAGPYPTVVKGPAGDTVLVATAWEWGKVLGELQVDFDAQGKVTSWSGAPKLVAGDGWVRIYDLPGADNKPVRVQYTKAKDGSWIAKEYDGKSYSIDPPPERADALRKALNAFLARYQKDPRFLFTAAKPEGVDKLKTYSAGVDALKIQVAAQASEELKRANNQGPGPLIAESMLVKTAARIAVMNPGGVRTNLNPGPLTVAQVYELQPFGNTLVTLELPGSEVLKVLEDMCDYTITHYDKKPDTAYIYVAGIRFTLNVNAAKGERVKNAEVKNAAGAYEPLVAGSTYKTVVNNFMAAGGDKNDTLKATKDQYDTGFIDSEAFLDYVRGKTLSNQAEARVKQIP